MALEDIRAGRAYVEIGTKDSDLVAGLNRSAKKLQEFGAAVRGIGLQIAAAGAAMFAPLAGAGAEFAEHGEALELASKQTGIAVENLSTLGYAAERSGVQMEDLEGAIARMNKSFTGAEQGAAASVEAFKRLGLTVADLQNLSPDARFKLIADRLAQIQDPGLRAGMAMEIFGKSAAGLLPLLSQGSAGIAALQARAQALGLQWSGEDAEAGEKLNHTLKDMWDVLKHTGDVIGSAVAPALTFLANLITMATIGVTNWIRENKTLFAVLTLVGAGIVAAGTSLVIFGTAIEAVGVAIGTLAAFIGVLMNPITLVIGGVGALIGAFLYFSGIGAKVGNSINAAFKSIWDVISFIASNTSTVWGAIGVGAAIAATYLQQAWAGAKGFVMNIWAGLGNWFQSLWDGIRDTMVSSFIEGIYGIQTAWENFSNWFTGQQKKLGDAMSQWQMLGDARKDADEQFGGKQITPALAKQAATINLNANEPENQKAFTEDFKKKNPGGSAEDAMAAYLDWKRKQIDQVAAKILQQAKGGDNQFSANDIEQIAQEKLKMAQTAEAGAGGAAALNPQDQQAEAAHEKRLAELKIQRDQALSDLAALSIARDQARDAETAKQKAANDKEAADAEARAKKAREDYEAALKQSHDQSGEQSLEDQLKKLLAPLTGADGGKGPDGAAGIDPDAMARAAANGPKDFGTFSAQAAASLGNGAGASNGPAEKTASAAQNIVTKLDTLVKFMTGGAGAAGTGMVYT